MRKIFGHIIKITKANGIMASYDGYPEPLHTLIKIIDPLLNWLFGRKCPDIVE